jgi:hypothetical protein
MEYIAMSYIVIGVAVFCFSFAESSVKMGLSYSFFWPVWAVAEFVRLFIWTVKEIISRFK